MERLREFMLIGSYAFIGTLLIAIGGILLVRFLIFFANVVSFGL